MVCLDKQMIRAYKLTADLQRNRMESLKKKVKLYYVMLSTITQQKATLANDEPDVEFLDTLNSEEEEIYSKMDSVLRQIRALLPQTSEQELNSKMDEIEEQLRNEVMGQQEPQEAAAAEEVQDPE